MVEEGTFLTQRGVLEARVTGGGVPGTRIGQASEGPQESTWPNLPWPSAELFPEWETEERHTLTGSTMKGTAHLLPRPLDPELERHILEGDD